MGTEKTALNHNRKNSLVTGGGGFLGKAIVKRLVNRGDRVFSFSRSFYPELETLGVSQFRGDLADAKAVSNACKNMDTVFHVAAKPGVWGKYQSFYNANFIGTENIIKGCKSNRVPILVYTSSPSVIFNGQDMKGVSETVPYPDTYHSHYPKTKAMAEKAVISASDDALKTISLRPHLIWGPEDNHLVPRIIARAKSLVQVGDGKNMVDTIYVDNAAKAHVMAQEALIKNPDLSGNVYFISNNEPVYLWDMVNSILKAGGCPPVKRSISAKTAWNIGACLEWIYRVFNLKGEPKMTRFVANELATSHWFDIGAAKNDLGYSPDISIDEGLVYLENWLNYKKECECETDRSIAT